MFPLTVTKQVMKSVVTPCTFCNEPSGICILSWFPQHFNSSLLLTAHECSAPALILTTSLSRLTSSGSRVCPSLLSPQQPSSPALSAQVWKSPASTSAALWKGMGTGSWPYWLLPQQVRMRQDMAQVCIDPRETCSTVAAHPLGAEVCPKSFLPQHPSSPPGCASTSCRSAQAWNDPASIRNTSEWKRAGMFSVSTMTPLVFNRYTSTILLIGSKRILMSCISTSSRNNPFDL
mmetsp:Transcript_6346/g.5568  ORF Transcript_6346/g.5568 Transcript_6346/m.5568 type:complete len:233 (-) Transcript_6346:635-1333(-)